MKVIDPGHFYELSHLDGPGTSLLRFVKRVGDKYPGNEGVGYEGVTIQEVLRVLLDRMKYVNWQENSTTNVRVSDHLRHAMAVLEERAAARRGDTLALLEALEHHHNDIETAPVCGRCGHIGCTIHGNIDP